MPKILKVSIRILADDPTNDSNGANPDRISNIVQAKAQISEAPLALVSSINSREQQETGVLIPLNGGDNPEKASPRSMSRTRSEMYFKSTGRKDANSRR